MNLNTLVDCPANAVDPAEVATFAQAAVAILRHFGFDNADIARYTLPNVVADAKFEDNQKIDRGFVVAPAAAVKREIARMLAAEGN